MSPLGLLMNMYALYVEQTIAKAVTVKETLIC